MGKHQTVSHTRSKLLMSKVILPFIVANEAVKTK